MAGSPFSAALRSSPKGRTLPAPPAPHQRGGTAPPTDFATSLNVCATRRKVRDSFPASGAVLRWRHDRLGGATPWAGTGHHVRPGETAGYDGRIAHGKSEAAPRGRFRNQRG